MARDGSECLVRPFQRADQAAARQVVLEGLAGHFGWLDPSLNTDLADIAGSYTDRGHVFLVAEVAGVLAGTGALLIGHGEAQIVRVSVDCGYRRRGLASALLAELLRAAADRGIQSVWMETNEDWADAAAFYLAEGFTPFDLRDGCIFMRRGTGPATARAAAT